jgi:hypothetical protein
MFKGDWKTVARPVTYERKQPMRKNGVHTEMCTMERRLETDIYKRVADAAEIFGAELGTWEDGPVANLLKPRLQTIDIQFAENGVAVCEYEMQSVLEDWYLVGDTVLLKDEKKDTE